MTFEGQASHLIPSTESFIDSNRLFESVNRLGLAVSGGSDSVALLHIASQICKRRGIVPVVLHFDHGLRGTASTEDTEIVRKVATDLGCEFANGIGRDIHGGGGISTEMAARNARHAFFRSAAAEHHLDAIATGHQANDVAETLLMRLMRGSGAAGLSGLKPVSSLNGLKIIRPLLHAERETLRAWLRMHGIEWRDDETNSDETITRNKIRHTYLPAIAKAAGGRDAGIVKSLAQSAMILRDEDSYLDAVAAKVLARSSRDGGIDIASIRCENAAIARRAARIWLMDRFGKDSSGFECVESLLNCRKALTLPGGHRLECRDGVISEMQSRSNPEPFPDVGFTPPCEFAYGAFSVKAELVELPLDIPKGEIGKWPSRCLLAADTKELHVRGRRPGDRIAPTGLDGSKKVQDVFVDAKIDCCERDAYPIVFSGNDVAWIPGYRVARGAALPRTAKTAISISISRL